MYRMTKQLEQALSELFQHGHTSFVIQHLKAKDKKTIQSLRRLDLNFYKCQQSTLGIDWIKVSTSRDLPTGNYTHVERMYSEISEYLK